MIGQTISHYRIIEKLGSGGMGVFTPSELKNNPVEAEMYLREKFQWHECKVGLKTKSPRPI
jgi:hypothetical protein